MTEPGDQAPDFELPDEDGSRAVKLGDLRGQMVVVYFYPKADTPGCTTQACGVRDHQRGVREGGRGRARRSRRTRSRRSRSSTTSTRLNFTLLADEDHAVAESYGVWVEKSMYGKTYWGVQRSTFIVNADGKIAAVLHKVKPGEHDALVLAALAAA